MEKLIEYFATHEYTVFSKRHIIEILQSRQSLHKKESINLLASGIAVCSIAFLLSLISSAVFGWQLFPKSKPELATDALILIANIIGLYRIIKALCRL